MNTFQRSVAKAVVELLQAFREKLEVQLAGAKKAASGATKDVKIETYEPEIVADLAFLDTEIASQNDLIALPDDAPVPAAKTAVSVPVSGVKPAAILPVSGVGVASGPWADPQRVPSPLAPRSDTGTLTTRVPDDHLR
jgi:hypothetical protein